MSSSTLACSACVRSGRVRSMSASVAWCTAASRRRAAAAAASSVCQGGRRAKPSARWIRRGRSPRMSPGTPDAQEETAPSSGAPMAASAAVSARVTGDASAVPGGTPAPAASPARVGSRRATDARIGAMLAGSSGSRCTPAHTTKAPAPASRLSRRPPRSSTTPRWSSSKGSSRRREGGTRHACAGPASATRPPVSPPCQSMSKYRACEEARPCASTSIHQGLSAPNTPMWLGTMSSSRPMPRSRSARTSASKASRVPSSGFSALGSTTS